MTEWHSSANRQPSHLQQAEVAHEGELARRTQVAEAGRQPVAPRSADQPDPERQWARSAGDATPGDATPGDATAVDATAGDATAGDATPGDATAGDAISTTDATTWWSFESEPDDTGRTRRHRVGAFLSGAWRYGRAGFEHSRWQLVADVVLVGALLVVLGLTAKLIVDPGSLSGDSDTAAAPAGNARAAELPGKGRTGARVVMRLRPSGDLVVKQWIEFKAPRKQLELANQPATISASSGGTVVRDLTVRTSGAGTDQRVRPLADGESRVLELDTTSRSFRLDYVVEGAVERSEPSASGRALVDLNGVRVQTASGPRTVRLTTGRTGAVMSLACGSASGAAEPCGRAGSKGWSVRLDKSAAADDVVASVDLPTA